MLFSLKKGIMCRALDKRNRKNPFDFEHAENYSIENESDTLINNSYYFSAHDENLSFFTRLGKRVSEDETWFAIFLDGKLYSLKQDLFPPGQSPVCIERSRGAWTIAYEGIVNDNDRIRFQARFVATQEPIDFTSNMPAERMATGIANEKWSKRFFDDLQNVSGQCHYEQEGILEGQFTLNGRTTDFHLPCVRDHSFGKRDWNYMNNHLWLMAVSPSLQFNYSLVSYPVISVLEVGNYRNQEGMHYLMQADLDFQTIRSGKVPQALSSNIRLDNHRTIHTAVRVIAGVTYPFKNGQYLLHENIAEFQIDGQVCRGILEIGFNRDSNRFFNQRDPSSIQR